MRTLTAYFIGIAIARSIYEHRWYARKTLNDGFPIAEVTESGETTLLVGEQVDRSEFEEANQKAALENLRMARPMK